MPNIYSYIICAMNWLSLIRVQSNIYLVNAIPPNINFYFFIYFYFSFTFMDSTYIVHFIQKQNLINLIQQLENKHVAWRYNGKKSRVFLTACWMIHLFRKTKSKWHLENHFYARFLVLCSTLFFKNPQA